MYLKTNNTVQEFRNIKSTPHKVKGAEEFLAHFLMMAADHPVLILSLHTAPGHDEHLQTDNLSIYSFARHPDKRRLLRWSLPSPLRQVILGVQIFVHILSFQPTRVLCWARFFPLWFCCIASTLIGAQVVFSQHMRFFAPTDPWFRRIIGRIDAFFARRAHAVIVHGPYLKHESLNLGIDPKRIIEFDCTYPPGSTWNPDLGQEKKNEFLCSIPCHVRSLLFIGRMDVSKGIFELYRACAPLLAADKNLRLIFAGHGPDMRPLMHLAQSADQLEQIHFLGYVAHSNLPQLIHEAYCVITPTRSSFLEGRCMAAMEGLVGGRPVIAPNFGPFPYLIQHQNNGLLYDPDSVDSLRTAIDQILQDEELYYNLCQGAECTRKKLCANTFSYYHALKAIWP